MNNNPHVIVFLALFKASADPSMHTPLDLVRSLDEAGEILAKRLVIAADDMVDQLRHGTRVPALRLSHGVVGLSLDLRDGRRWVDAGFAACVAELWRPPQQKSSRGRRNTGVAAPSLRYSRRVLCLRRRNHAPQDFHGRYRVSSDGAFCGEHHSIRPVQNGIGNVTRVHFC